MMDATTERLHTPENQETVFSQHIAAEIGGDIIPTRLLELIVTLNNGHYLVHGIKREKDVAKVRKEGIAPLTPEGGMVSYWNSGKEIFGTGNGTGMRTLNSTFFNWAHSQSEGPVLTMNMALTTAEQAHVRFRPDAEVTIPFSVPPDSFHLLRVEVDRTQFPDTTRRQLAQRAEQAMFSLLERAASGNLPRGGQTVVSLSRV